MVETPIGGHRWAFDMNTEMSLSESFSSSFFMILATEMGDETFIIAAVMAMRHPKTTVLAGALSALYFMTVLSAGLGLLLPNLISQQNVHNCATVLYTFFGFRLMYIGAKGEEEDKDEEFEEVENNLKESATKSQKSVVRRMFSKFCTPIFLEALMLTFLAEWGDRSQIATNLACLPPKSHWCDHRRMLRTHNLHQPCSVWRRMVRQANFAATRGLWRRFVVHMLCSPQFLYRRCCNTGNNKGRCLNRHNCWNWHSSINCCRKCWSSDSTSRSLKGLLPIMLLILP